MAVFTRTGSAANVGFDSATLTAEIAQLSTYYYYSEGIYYYFRYWSASATYRDQTAIVDAGTIGFGQTRAVSIAVTGLAPLTLYHYQVVVETERGESLGRGEDRTFTTAAIPFSLQILASPNPVPYGSLVTIQGALAGVGNADREVVLQASPFPFGGFSNVGNPELTTADGSYAFHVPNATATTDYRVVTTTSPVVDSPVATETVTPRLRAQAHRLAGRETKGKLKVRFSGSTRPALNGERVRIVHVMRGRSVFVASIVLRKASGGSSRFSRVIRVPRGIYRAQLRLESGSLASTESVQLLVR